MDDNQTETQFIRNCLVMSFDELGIFINDCLEQLEKQSNSDIDFPTQERTYNELISLLEKKIRDDLKTPEISKYLQYFRDKNSYYSKSNNKYEEFTKSVKSFLESLEQIKSKFKALKSSEIPDLDNLAFIIKSQKDFPNFDENARTEIENIVTAKIISNEMISCVMETLFLLQQNTELYDSICWYKNSSSTPLLKSFDRLLISSHRINNRLNLLDSFGNLLNTSEHLVKEKKRLEEERTLRLAIRNSMKQSSYKENNALFTPITPSNLEHILKNMINAWVLYIESHFGQFQKKEFYYGELVKLQNSLIQESTEFIDGVIFSVEINASDEFEVYEKQVKINPEVLQKELDIKLKLEETKLKREEEEILEKPLEERRNLIISLRSKKKNAFRKIFEKGKFEIIPFDIFPKADVTISRFIQILRSGGMSISYEDEMRLYKIAERFPNYQSICIGKDEFKGFVVFRFKDTDAVIVEKPSYGNATYLVKGNWEKTL